MFSFIRVVMASLHSNGTLTKMGEFLMESHVSQAALRFIMYHRWFEFLTLLPVSQVLGLQACPVCAMLRTKSKDSVCWANTVLPEPHPWPGDVLT